MSEEHNDENKPKQPQSPEHATEHHKTQHEIDEEIAAIQQHARHQHPNIECPPERPPASPRKGLMILGIALLVLLGAGLLTMLGRFSHTRALAHETEEASIPNVSVVHPLAEQPDVELVLPGSLQAFKESPIYARTSGYLLRWYKDIGSRVKKGDLLAQIDTPEVDQELNQARAARQQMQAQMELAKITASRWENLRKTDSVSQQETDQQSSTYQQSRANLAASDANVRRLEQLESFKNVYAPFDGVLTRRNVDPGALINAGAGGMQLFNLAQVDVLRVYTSVPQAYAPLMKPGVKATITLQELPGQKFAATVARTAEAIDPATRTLLTEVDVPNPEGRLLPGSFGEIHFAVGSKVQKLTVPVNAMLFRAENAQIAVVGPNHKVELRALNIGRDYGTTLEVLGGLSVDDLIVINPPDSLEQGQQVNVGQPPPGQPNQQPHPQKGGGA